MKALAATTLRGNWATLLLPLNRDDSIDYGLLGAEIEHFIAERVDGIYSNGSAGEFHAQTEDEFDRISELLATKCEAAAMPFQIGACHMSAQISLHRLRRARPLAPGAFQVVLPDWFAPSWSEIVAFFETMAAEAGDVPLVLYNPPHAKRRLATQECLALVQAVPAIVGMKLPGGDEDWYQAMQTVFERVSVFIPGHTLATGLARGAHGAYSNVACLSPGGAQRWADLCRRDAAAGLVWQHTIQSFWQRHVAPLISEHGLSNMAADKAAAAAGGWLEGFSPRLRWPYRGASPPLVAALAAAARAELAGLFEL